MRKPALLSALLLGAALLTGTSAGAQPRPHNPRAWHGARPVVHNRFVFHHDFHHFTPVEHRWWVGGRWRHMWWHGRWGWWWGVGGAWYFYNAPVYPYPVYVSPTYYDDDYYGGDDQGYGDYQGDEGGYGPGVWYHCSNPEGYYPYIRDCHGGWQQVPATPPGGEMQGGPPPGGPGAPGGYGPPPGGGPGGPGDYGPPPGGGPGDYGPPPGGQYPDDQNGPPPPDGPYPGDQNGPPPPGH
jgi:hypothetical protein